MALSSPRRATLGPLLPEPTRFRDLGGEDTTSPIRLRPQGGTDIGDALAARVRPTSARQDRLLPLLSPLAPLFPNGGLQRGSVVAIDAGPPPRSGKGEDSADPGAGGATTLAYALLAAASATGSWCAAVGTADLGALALAEIGVDLGHLAFVPHPGPAWPEVSAVLVDGMDAVLVFPPWPTNLQVARRLAARARERQAVLIVMSPRSWWPEGPEIRLAVRGGSWQGVGLGHGYLQGRQVEVLATGRRVATRPVSAALWLPARSGAPSSL